MRSKNTGVSQMPATPPTDDSLAVARASLRKQLNTRIEQNRAHMDKLQKDSRRVPLLALLFLLTIPAGIYWGFAGVGLVTVVTVFCLCSAAYLVWGHKEEYRQRIGAAEAELRKL